MTEKKTKTQLFKSLSQSKSERLKNGNLEIIITVPWEIVSSEYEKTLNNFVKTVDIKGFRPGKAPKNLVEKSIGKNKIYQELIKTLFTEIYLEAVKTHKILPIVNPKLSLISSEEGKDWQVKAITAEIPKFDLDDYKNKIKKELAPEKIWVPGKDKELDKEKAESQEEKLQKIFITLLKTVKIDLPQLLVEDEVNRMLSRLIDQTARLGLTVEQYLTSISKTSEQLRAEYQKQAEESLKLELILSRIASLEKITIEDKEVEAMIKASGDEKVQKTLETPTQKAYIRQILRKRKVIDILVKL